MECVCQNFDRKLTDSRFCNCAVKIRPGIGRIGVTLPNRQNFNPVVSDFEAICAKRQVQQPDIHSISLHALSDRSRNTGPIIRRRTSFAK